MAFGEGMQLSKWIPGNQLVDAMVPMGARMENADLCAHICSQQRCSIVQLLLLGFILDLFRMRY